MNQTLKQKIDAGFVRLTEIVKQNIIDNLSSSSIDKSLSARQGKVLDDKKLEKSEWSKIATHFDFDSLNEQPQKLYIQHALYPKYCGAIAKNNANFSDSTGVIISQGQSESAGIKLCGDKITMYSPVDDAFLHLIDEDGSGNNYWKVNTSGNIEKSSDRRLKENLQPLDDINLKEFAKLFVGSFDWIEANDEVQHLRNELIKNRKNYTLIEKRLMRRKLIRLKKKSKNIGAIAQQIQKVFPFSVHQNRDTKMLSVDIDNLNFGLFKVVQQLVLKVDELETKLQTEATDATS